LPSTDKIDSLTDQLAAAEESRDDSDKRAEEDALACGEAQAALAEAEDASAAAGEAARASMSAVKEELYLRLSAAEEKAELAEKLEDRVLEGGRLLAEKQAELNAFREAAGDEEDTAQAQKQALASRRFTEVSDLKAEVRLLKDDRSSLKSQLKGLGIAPTLPPRSASRAEMDDDDDEDSSVSHSLGTDSLNASRNASRLEREFGGAGAGGNNNSNNNSRTTTAGSVGNNHPNAATDKALWRRNSAPAPIITRFLTSQRASEDGLDDPDGPMFHKST
jgi:hypothetical protein